MTSNDKLIILRYPARDGDAFVLLQPSLDDEEVYQIASSWFDSLVEAKEELKRCAVRLRRKGDEL